MIAALCFTTLLAFAEQTPPVPHRPRDPWVFRSVLDKQARIVTIALSDELWVAYDATHCSLYKAWKGGVHFDGAVYTTVHGPQPTTQGNAYSEGIAGDVWQATVGGQDVAVKTVWRGYAYHDQRVTLKYDLVLADGRKIAMQETPEFVQPEGLVGASNAEDIGTHAGHPGLLRSFLAADIPSDVRLSLAMRTDGAEAKVGGPFEREQITDVVDDKGVKSTHIVSHLVLLPERYASNVALFFAPLPDPVPEAKPAAGESAKKPEAALPAKKLDSNKAESKKGGDLR